MLYKIYKLLNLHCPVRYKNWKNQNLNQKHFHIIHILKIAPFQQENIP